MKLALLFAVISLSISSFTNAEEVSDNDDYVLYCEEQAQLAGMEDTNEKKDYIDECLESYIAPADDSVAQEQG